MSEAEGGDDDAPRTHGSLLDRFLRIFSDVRAGEGATALILLAAIFVLLVAYYVLKTVREPLVLVSAAQDLALLRGTGLPAWLTDAMRNESGGAQLKAVAAGCQALVLLAYVPLYSAVAARVSRIRLIAFVSIFFVLCIETFFALRLVGVPLLGFFFFIWLGIFSVSMVAQFWSFGNDVYAEEAGKRLFPIIGVGATAGSPVGSKVAGLLYDYLAPEVPEGGHASLDGFQRWLIASELDPSFILLQLPALLLLVFLGLMLWAAARVEKELTRTPGTRPSTMPPPPSQLARAKEPGGLRRVLESPYLRLIGAIMLVLNLVNTTGELLLSARIAEEAARLEASGAITSAGAWIGSFYGDFFTWVNVGAFLIQALVVSRVIKLFGLRGVLFALPLVAFGSYGLFALGVGLATLRWAKTAENATDYSIMNTGKALVWLPTSRRTKYEAKQAVDTLLVRFGDLLAAVLFLVGTGALAFDMQTLAGVNLVLVAGWLVLTFFLVRKHAQIEEDPSRDPVATAEVH